MFIYVISEYFFIFQSEKKVIVKNLIFSHFAFNILNNLFISELPVEAHCKTLHNSTGD